MLFTNQAFNALLKTLEEPPSHVVFILATTEPHKIPLTILSRCQRYDFRRISEEDIVNRMEWIVKEENADIQPEALQLIAQIAAGGMRDALSLLDQSISRSENQVTLQDVIELTGAVDTRKIGKLIQHVAAHDIEKSLEYFNECYQSGQESQFFIEEMMNYYRDILIFKKLNSKASLKKGLTDPAFESIVKVVEVNTIFSNLEVLQNAMNKLKFHQDAQLLVEMSIIEMAQGFGQINEANELQNLKAEVEQLKAAVFNGQTSTIIKSEPSETASPIETNTREDDISEEMDLNKESLNPLNISLNEIIKDVNQIVQEQVDSVELGTTPFEDSVEPDAVDIFTEAPENYQTFKDEYPEIEDHQPDFISTAVEKREEWVQVIEDEMDSKVVETQEEVLPFNESEEGNTLQNEDVFEDVVDESSDVLLSDDEEEVLELLNSCTKNHKLAFKESHELLMNTIKDTNISTYSLYREFDIKGINDTHVVMSHEEGLKVKLLNKVKNKAIVESCFEEIYGRKLSIAPVTKATWDRIYTEYLNRRK